MKAGAEITGLALESALWCRYCYGTKESGQTIEPNDPNWDRLTATARSARDDPMTWLAMEDIYGGVGRSEVFREQFDSALRALWSDGVQSVVTRYVEGTP